MRIWSLIIFGMSVVWPSTVFADLKTDISTCAVLAGALFRLDCFDRAAQASNLDGPQPVAVDVTNPGEWVINRSKNPIDDTETVLLSLKANSGTSSSGEPITFNARCKSNATEAYIVWGDYLGNDAPAGHEEWKSVTVRMGTNRAEVQRWSLSNDSQSTFAPNWAGNLLSRMLAAPSFVAQITPYNDNAITAIFDTTGMEASLAPLMEVCRWPAVGPEGLEGLFPSEADKLARELVCKNWGLPKGSPAMIECMTNHAYRR